MAFTASTGQQAANLIQVGPGTLNTPAAITQASPTGAGFAITSQEIAISLVPTGTLDNASVTTLQVEINGSQFVTAYYPGTATPVSWTGTLINTSVGGQAGVHQMVKVKGNRIRFVLTNQTTPGGGVTPRVMD